MAEPMSLDAWIARRLVQLPARNRPPVLVYHHVGAPIPGADPGLSIAPSTFERHLDWLAAHGFAAMSASDWLDALQGRSALPPRPVLITFDDGYRALDEHALPALHERGFRATVFVVTRFIGGVSEWERTAHMPLLAEADIRRWAELGIEFGSHTRTHARLTALGESEQRDELEGSREDLSAVLGRPPRAFAYPYGLVDDDTHRLVADVFDVAFTIREGSNHPGGDRHLMRRSGALEEDSLSDLALRLRIGWTPRHRLRHRARRRLGRARQALTDVRR